MRYHVSLDGKTRPCRAKGACPFGTAFENKAIADKYVERKDSVIDTLKHKLETNTQYTEDEAIERGKFVDETTDKLVKSKKDTKSLYFNEITQEYSKERRKLHREILDELHEQYKDVPEDGKVMFSAGLPGAGKTTVLKMLKDEGEEGVDIKDFATVSSDDFKEIFAKKGMIPEVEGLVEMEASTLVHSESSDLADTFLRELGERKKNVIYDFTCKDVGSTARRMKILTDRDYEVKDMQFVFVDIPLETAEERATGRYIHGLNEYVESGGETIGGRYLPKRILYRNKPEEDTYSSVNAESVLDIHDVYKDEGLPKPIIYDNSGNIFKDPTYKPERQDFDEFSNRRFINK